MAPRYPSIPEPTIKVESLRDAVLTIKQVLEILTGQRGNPDYRAVLLPEVTGPNEKVSKSGDTMSGGLGFGKRLADTPDDVTKHIALWDDTYGFSVTPNTLNVVVDDVLAMKLSSLSGATIESSLLVNGGGRVAGGLRVNGAIHDWPLNVRAGPNINVGFIDGGGGLVVLGNINDAGSAWTPIQINSPLGMANHLTPTVTATYNLGSAALRWSTVYTSDLSLKNEHGDWTIVEGEDDLFLYNNKKNKTYKFTLTEVDPATVPPKKV